MTGSVIREAFRRNRLLAVTALAHALLFLLLIPAAILDPREILGVSRWIKPMKFAISIAIFTATMAWLLDYVQAGARGVRIVSRTITVAMCGETLLIVMQAARGVRSHFNEDTPFDAAVFSTMGVLIVMNTVAVAYTGLLFLRRPVSISGAYLTGVRLGLLVFVVASLEGGLMVGRGSHSVGVHDGSSPGLPFVNWSTCGGDLRVAHFAGMHALQGLPLLGWILDRNRTRAARGWVAAAAAVWFLTTAILVMHALTGRPLLAMG